MEHLKATSLAQPHGIIKTEQTELQRKSDCTFDRGVHASANSPLH
jgi:hypothetical protein